MNINYMNLHIIDSIYVFYIYIYIDLLVIYSILYKRKNKNSEN